MLFTDKTEQPAVVSISAQPRHGPFVGEMKAGSYREGDQELLRVVGGLQAGKR